MGNFIDTFNTELNEATLTADEKVKMWAEGKRNEAMHLSNTMKEQKIFEYFNIAARAFPKSAINCMLIAEANARATLGWLTGTWLTACTADCTQICQYILQGNPLPFYYVPAYKGAGASSEVPGLLVATIQENPAFVDEAIKWYTEYSKRGGAAAGLVSKMSQANYAPIVSFRATGSVNFYKAWSLPRDYMANELQIKSTSPFAHNVIMALLQIMLGILKDNKEYAEGIAKQFCALYFTKDQLTKYVTALADGHWLEVILSVANKL